jgi:hypothetical protein
LQGTAAKVQRLVSSISRHPSQLEITDAEWLMFRDCPRDQVRHCLIYEFAREHPETKTWFEWLGAKLSENESIRVRELLAEYPGQAGISKIYFVELPKDVQERFHYGSATPTGKAVTQRIDENKSTKHAAAFVSDADRFAQQVATKLEERESILHGKQAKTRSWAESMAIQELNFHKAFLAGTAIIASVLFAIVWARFK